MTRYPAVLENGLSEPWYFVARMTTNHPHKDIEFGDRTLAIY